MTLDIKLPELPGGAATVLRWLAGEGEAVAQGAPLLIVLTERAEMLLPAPDAGTLAELLPIGAQVEPGGRLGRLQEEAGRREKGEGGEDTAGVAPRRRLLATPLARAIARDRGVDLLTAAGSGAGGRVLARDVRAQLGEARPALDELAGGRQPAAEARSRPLADSSAVNAQASISHSRFSIPIATATVEFDASSALARVAAHQAEFARLRLPLGLSACVLEAAAALLPAHPLLNGSWTDDGLMLRRRLHVAVAEPAGDGAGLRWALVRDAGDLTLRGVARALARRAGPEGATFAVVCLAAGVGWQSAAPPLPGTAAALSVGAPVARAVAVGEALAVCPMATITLSYDARMSDHCVAAAFLAALRGALERV
jgi:pyruvate/2-oxoglutarate dehydrogenase complex dihydrolipoamide acyltransferase (E2) component